MCVFTLFAKEVTKDEVILQLQEALKHEEQRANSLTASIDSKSSSFVAAYEAQLDRLHSDNSKLREDYLHLQEQHQSVLDTYVKKEKLLSRDVTELRERLTEITNEVVHYTVCTDIIDFSWRTANISWKSAPKRSNPKRKP